MSYKIDYSIDTQSTNTISFATIGNVINSISLHLEGIKLDIIKSLLISTNSNSIKINGLTMRVLNMVKGNNNPENSFLNFPIDLLYRFYANAMINVYNIIITLDYDVNLFIESDIKMKKILNEHYVPDISNIILEYGTYGSIGEIVLNTHTDTINTKARYSEYEVILCSSVTSITLDLNKASFNNIIIVFINDGKFIDILVSCTLNNNILPVVIKNNIYTITNIIDGCSLLNLNISHRKQIMFLHVITY